MESLRFTALGDHCEIHYVATSPAASRAFARASSSWLAAFEAKYSRFRPDSLIGRINSSAGRAWVDLDADAERMFVLADRIHVLSRGIIDVSVLPLVRLWNRTPQHASLPSPEEITEAVRLVGWSRVRREPGRIYLPEAGMGIDLGGFGKEFAVDRVHELAESHGIADCLVAIGDDMRSSGAPPDADRWIVGTGDPASPAVVGRRLAVNDAGVATSGDYLRYFETAGRRFGHIVDPRTGHPVRGECRSVTVVAGSCLEAGILATTAFVLGSEDGLRLIEDFFGAEGLVVCDDRELETRGLHPYRP
ncbi:FAD:protein FMN transferase [Opitutales bacterium ASA1]|uniref:FAD:protein FMN transferase n=1 Tax=Congregicoccus parvus TaxID=3081749 RepID=UPI002B30C5E0|nr:FAD:protein FMN transferase [Opitutales bacterium ASA1]